MKTKAASMKSLARKLVLLRPDAQKHAEAIYDLTGKTFGDYWNWLAECRRRYFGDGFYDWDASTIGLLDGKIVTHWGIWGYNMRIGRAVVRSAGVGAVATAGDLRRRGLMTKTAFAAVEASGRAGYDLSILFGRWDFYDRFGFVASWPWRTYIAAAERLPKEPPGVRLYKFDNEFDAPLVKLYNRQSAGLTGTAVRPTYAQPRKGWQRYLWRGAGGRPAGYVVVSVGPGGLELVDHAGDVEKVLRVVSQLARQRRAKDVRFSALHYESELAKRLRRGFCRVEMQYVKSGGAMVRTLNLASTLKKMAGELSSRLRASHLAEWRGRLLIADPREKVVLKIDRSKVETAPAGGRCSHAVRGGEEIAQLLIGTYEPNEVAEAGKMRLTGDARHLIEALFPCQHPILAAPDLF